MFHSCLRLFSKASKRELSVDELLRTDVYVMHLLNTIVDVSIHYMNQLDEDETRLAELSSQQFAMGEHSISLLTRIKMELPEKTSAIKMLRAFKYPEALESLDGSHESPPDKDTLLVYLKCAASLCDALTCNHVRAKDALSYQKGIRIVAHIIQAVAPIKESSAHQFLA